MKNVTLTMSAMALLFAFTNAEALPLTDKVDVMGEVRARSELQMNYDFDGDTDDDNNFQTLRSTLGFTARPFEGLDVTLQARDWRLFGEEGPGGYGDDDFLLYQGYFTAKFNEGKYQVKVGRQEVVLGTERIFSNNGDYKGLYHDAAVFSYVGEQHMFHAFTARFTEGFASGKPGVEYSDDYAWTGWYTWKRNENASLHAYLVSAKLNTQAGDPTLYTVGISYDDDSFERVFFGAELIPQFGQLATTETDISAFAAHAHIGVKFSEAKHRLWLDINAASGNDDDAESIEEFNNLFGKNALGEMNFVAFRNVVHAGLKYSGKFLDDKLGLDLGLHMFSMMSEDGDLYTIDVLSGAVSKIGTGNGDDTAIGSEFDAFVSYTWNEYLSFRGGVGIFAPGDAWKKDGDSATLVSLGATAKF